MSLAIPTVEDLARSPELAALATLEIALTVVARSLRALYPGVDRYRRPGDSADLAAACAIVDDCEVVLYSIENYRSTVDGLGRTLHNLDWPF